MKSYLSVTICVLSNWFPTKLRQVTLAAAVDGVPNYAQLTTFVIIMSTVHHYQSDKQKVVCPLFDVSRL